MFFFTINLVFSISTFLVLHVAIPAMFGMLLVSMFRLLCQYMHYLSLPLYYRLKYGANEAYARYLCDRRRKVMLQEINNRLDTFTDWREFVKLILHLACDVVDLLALNSRNSANALENYLQCYNYEDHFCSYVFLTLLRFNVNGLSHSLHWLHAWLKDQLAKFKAKRFLTMLKPSHNMFDQPIYIHSTPRSEPARESYSDDSDIVDEPQYQLAQPEQHSVSRWLYENIVLNLPFTERSRIRKKNAMRAQSRKRA